MQEVVRKGLWSPINQEKRELGLCPPGYLLWQWWVFMCSYMIRANALEIYIVAGLFNEPDPDVVRQRDMFEAILVKYLLNNCKNLSEKTKWRMWKWLLINLKNCQLWWNELWCTMHVWPPGPSWGSPGWELSQLSAFFPNSRQTIGKILKQELVQ